MNNIMVNLIVEAVVITYSMLNLLYMYWQLAYDLWTYCLHTVYSLLENLYRFFYPVRRKSLDKEIILVTGSAVGIGRAICLQLAAKTKAKLVLWDVKKEENDELGEILRQFGTQAKSYHVDLCSRSQIEAAADKVRNYKKGPMILKKLHMITIPHNLGQAGSRRCHHYNK